MVFSWKTSGIETSKPAARRAPTRRTARIESPPRSKKLSSTPTCGRPSTSAHTAASRSSTGVRGATNTAPANAARSGAGSARWSTLPLPFSGTAASSTKAAGTMYSGRACARWVRSAAVSSAAPSTGTTYPTRDFSPASLSRTATTTSRTDACSRSRASISPSSMR